MTMVPFENLDVLLGRGIRIDLDSIYAKLVTARRGGYCFEHGTLLLAGVAATRVSAASRTPRASSSCGRAAEAPLTHMFLTVQIDGTTLVLDPGFGGHAPRGSGPAHRRRSARRRRCPSHGAAGRRVGARSADRWRAHRALVIIGRTGRARRLRDGQPLGLDVPESPFVTRLMLRALTPTVRVSMMNQDVTVRDASGQQKRVITDRADLRRFSSIISGSICRRSSGCGCLQCRNGLERE